MDLPIDTANLHIIIGEPCAARTDRETGQQRTDRTTGKPIFDTGLIVGDGTQSAPLRVKTFFRVDAAQMTPVRVWRLVLTQLVMRDGAKVEYFSAEKIETITSGDGGEWGPPAAAKAAGSGSSGSGKASA